MRSSQSFPSTYRPENWRVSFVRRIFRSLGIERGQGAYLDVGVGGAGATVIEAARPRRRGDWLRPVSARSPEREQDSPARRASPSMRTSSGGTAPSSSRSVSRRRLRRARCARASARARRRRPRRLPSWPASCVQDGRLWITVLVRIPLHPAAALARVRLARPQARAQAALRRGWAHRPPPRPRSRPLPRRRTPGTRSKVAPSWRLRTGCCRRRRPGGTAVWWTTRASRPPRVAAALRGPAAQRRLRKPEELTPHEHGRGALHDPLHRQARLRVPRRRVAARRRLRQRARGAAARGARAGGQGGRRRRVAGVERRRRRLVPGRRRRGAPVRRRVVRPRPLEGLAPPHGSSRARARRVPARPAAGRHRAHRRGEPLQPEPLRADDARPPARPLHADPVPRSRREGVPRRAFRRLRGALRPPRRPRARAPAQGRGGTREVSGPCTGSSRTTSRSRRARPAAGAASRRPRDRRRPGARRSSGTGRAPRSSPGGSP